MSTLELLAPTDDRVPEVWSRLERLAAPPYFLTWGWIENWLALLPAEVAPSLAVISEGREVVGAFFLGRHRLWRHRVLPSRGLFVNATGVARHDELCIEHNAILTAPGHAVALDELVELLPGDWDELFLPGMARAPLGALAVRGGYRVLVDRDDPSPYVDLERVRTAGDYLGLLSPNTRAQIRRARRRLGASELEIAATLEQALAIYGELVELHGARWRREGKTGAFADPWFERFHRRLIEQRFERGEIQLARVRSTAGTLGCLYNLVANGRVLFYQSGIASHADPVVKPGYLCHAAAIEHNAIAGHAVYDLLAGDARYKTSLATDAIDLVWLRVQRERARFAIEDRMRTWKHAFADAIAPRRTS